MDQYIQDADPQKPASQRGTSWQDVVLGERLRNVRRMQRMSMRRLADVLGVTYQQVHKYESGLNRMSVAMLARACAALGVPCELMVAGLAAEPNGEANDVAVEQNPERFAEAMELLRAFGAVRDAAHRRQVLKVVESIADALGQKDSKLEIAD